MDLRSHALRYDGASPHPSGAETAVLAGRRVCSVLLELLGNRTFSLRLSRVVERLAGGPVPEVWFSQDSYRRHPAPLPARVSDELEAELVFRRMLAREPLPAADVYFVNGIGLASVARPLRPEARWIVATDCTPALTDRLRASGFGERPGLLRRAFRSAQGLRFGALARAIDLWLPMSEACRESLVTDYGVDPARCLVTSAPQLEIDAALPERDPLERPFQLLFAGNDFVRKGGPLLCAVARELDGVVLTVVSRDPEARRHHDGGRVVVVDHVEGPEQLRDLYRTSHLLVHPTHVDHYSHVICEGMARGLPFLVTIGTPAAELVSSGGGRLLPHPPDFGSLRAAIREVMSDVDGYRGMEASALAFAAQRLAIDGFIQRLTALLLREGMAADAASG